jgi:hypothetical protein
VAGRSLGGDGGADEVGNFLGQCPQAGAVDVDEAFVADLLAAQQPPDDVDALDEAVVAHVLAWPFVAGDSLVGRFARAERRPEPAGKHLRECRDRLGDDRRVIALARRVDHPERQLRGGQRGAEERPCETGFALALTPWAEVVGRHACGEPRLLGVLDVAEQLRGADLFVRTMEADDGHGWRDTRSHGVVSRACPS